MVRDSAPWNLKLGAPVPPCVRLFGVQLTDSNHLLASLDMGSLRKSVSMGNLGLAGFQAASQMVSDCMQPAHAEPEGAPYPGAAAHGEPQQGYASDGLMQSCSVNLRERKKGVPWTEDEHRLFLAGLQKLGKGDWRGISRNFVTTRTPTQVASHAQKYYLRQSNLSKRKRSSLFDIINANAAFGSTAMDLSQTFRDTVAEVLVQPALELNRRHPMASSSYPQNKQWSSVYSKSPLSVPPSVCADLRLASSHSQRWEAFPDNVLPAHASSLDMNKLALLSSKNSFADNTPLESNCQSKTFHTISSSSSSSKSASFSSPLCRIDDTSELSSLSLRIGPPIQTEALELHDRKLQQPVITSKLSIIPPAKVIEHSEVLLTMGAGTATGNANNAASMSSAIRVV